MKGGAFAECVDASPPVPGAVPGVPATLAPPGETARLVAEADTDTASTAASVEAPLGTVAWLMALVANASLVTGVVAASVGGGRGSGGACPAAAIVSDGAARPASTVTLMPALSCSAAGGVKENVGSGSDSVAAATCGSSRARARLLMSDK
mmetsp:Transcript_61229/g.148110  ORF Transcript_61229/g.148110 Transcript_61229/m.148110 type:complete len:151 (-) Transcript_61229:195-647(-)